MGALVDAACEAFSNSAARARKASDDAGSDAAGIGACAKITPAVTNTRPRVRMPGVYYGSEKT
jgi:hypothetical protein